jgi:hypothetical protein
MDDQSDLFYFRQRLTASTAAALQAADSGAKMSHQQLAAAYALRIDAIISANLKIAPPVVKPAFDAPARSRTTTFAAPALRRSGGGGLLRPSPLQTSGRQAS